jgi:uncharacterized membrane protein
MTPEVGNNAPLPVTRLERALQWFSRATLVAWLGYGFLVWDHIPARVPTHFGFTGAPDAWGDRSVLLTLPAIGLAAFIGISLLERIPHRLNYSGVTITPSNRAAVYRWGRLVLLSTKSGLLIMFGYIFFASTQVALGDARDIGVWFVPAVLLVTIGGLVGALVQLLRLR